MTVEHYVVRFSNSAVDANNFQLVDFDFSSAQAATVPETLARIEAYIQYVASVNIIATGTQIESIAYRAAGDPGGIDQPFPTAAYASLRTAAAADGVTIPIVSDGYGTVFGGDALAPLGTSVSVSERTETVGPTGRGRHFLPFISRAAVAGGGYLSPTEVINVKAAYDWFLLPISGTYVSNGGDTIPVVTNRLQTTQFPIVLVKAQAVFSNLESRRR